MRYPVRTLKKCMPRDVSGMTLPDDIPEDDLNKLRDIADCWRFAGRSEEQLREAFGGIHRQTLSLEDFHLICPTT